MCWTGCARFPTTIWCCRDILRIGTARSDTWAVSGLSRHCASTEERMVATTGFAEVHRVLGRIIASFGLTMATATRPRRKAKRSRHQSGWKMTAPLGLSRPVQAGSVEAQAGWTNPLPSRCRNDGAWVRSEIGWAKPDQCRSRWRTGPRIPENLHVHQGFAVLLRPLWTR